MRNRILLISGHGEGDFGEVSEFGREDKLARDFTRRLKKRMKKSGIKAVRYPASRDVYYRCKIGEEPEFGSFDYVLEVHFHRAEIGAGVLFFVGKRKEPHPVEEAVLLALRRAGFPVLGEGIEEKDGLLTANLCERENVPYGLLNIAFLNGREDMEKYQKHKKAFVRAIRTGLENSLSLCKENLKSI